jgi:hypothetical protein
MKKSYEARWGHKRLGNSRGKQSKRNRQMQAKERREAYDALSPLAQSLQRNNNHTKYLDQVTS